ncbi:hypothetical protein SESBI_07777 [Sesbania bispinosa]|nr:hypothetical protein SESBI_07777 [Sesbania bispinosa]
MTSLRSNPSALRWTASGDPSRPNLSATSGKDEQIEIVFVSAIEVIEFLNCAFGVREDEEVK